MGFGLYSVKDPSRFVAGSAAGAAATTSRMDKVREDPGPTAGGVIAAGLGGAMMGATVASDIGRAKGLPKTAPKGKPTTTAMAHQLETAETAAAGMRKTAPADTGDVMTQSKFEKYGAGVMGLAGMAAHFFS